MIAQRMEHARGLADTLFVLNTLGDDRAVAETWVMGAAPCEGVSLFPALARPVAACHLLAP